MLAAFKNFDDGGGDYDVDISRAQESFRNMKTSAT
jgi:hypothetical protein